jgi:VWFA-related protein
MPAVRAMRKFGGIIVLLAGVGSCLGQLDPPGSSDAPIKVDVDVVNVLCTVYDQHNALVSDLTKSDFEVRDNGRLQQIRYFARDKDLPLTVAMLVDVSGSVRSFVEDEKDAATQFFHAVIRPTDQALLLGFSSTMILWQDFTPSVERLSQALSHLHAIPYHGLPRTNQPMPSTLLYDAVYVASRDKLANISGRKVMLIISDGLDNGSQNHLEEAVAAVQANNVIVYGICYQSGFSGCSFLNELAQPTGGRMFEAGKKTPLSAIFQTIEDELRSQYALGYVPSDGELNGAYRKLHVRVLRRGLRVRARKGYYARRGDGK